MSLILGLKSVKYWCIHFCKYKHNILVKKENSRINKRCYRYLYKNNPYTYKMFPEISKKWITFFKSNFEKTTFPTHSENALVLVETREDERLAFVIHNVSYYVPNWKLYIFHSKENKDYILNILGDKRDNIVLQELINPIHSPADYNDLLLTFDFWNTFTAHKKVLLFQTDSFMLRSGIADFLQFDYIGAPWKWWEEQMHDMQRMGGNGGFSIRNVAKMKEIILKYKDLKAPEIEDSHNEDVFFSYYLYHDKDAILPSFHDALLFASESILCQKSLAVHQTWRFFKTYKPKFIRRTISI